MINKFPQVLSVIATIRSRRETQFCKTYYGSFKLFCIIHSGTNAFSRMLIFRLRLRPFSKSGLHPFSATWVKVANARDEAAMATSREKVFSWALMLVVLLLLLPQISCTKSSKNCPLLEVQPVPHEWHKPGDLNIGGMASQIICFFPAVNFERYPYVDLDIELAV